jgi:ATP/ADP translocase
MIAFSVLFGFFSGTVIGLFTATIAMTASKPNEIGSYMGMALGVLSISTLTGTPISGALISSYGSYHPAIIFAGVATLVGSAVIFGARAVFAGGTLIA